MKAYKQFSLLLLRLGLGWYFIYAGWTKVITYFTPAKDWTASGFLSNSQSPFADFFVGMAGNPVIDYLNAFGLLLIGLGLFSGTLVRFAAFWGSLLMVLYYLAGYPPENAFIIDDHIIFVFAFIVLAAFGAGRYLGLDGYIEKEKFVKKNRWLLKFLG